MLKYLIQTSIFRYSKFYGSFTHETRIKDAVNMGDLICLLATVRTLKLNTMHPSVFTELLINLLTFLPFHWKLKLTSIRAIKNGVQRRHYVIFVGFGYKKSLGNSFFGAWADFHWSCERSFTETVLNVKSFQWKEMISTALRSWLKCSGFPTYISY